MCIAPPLSTLLLALFFTYGHAYIAINEKWPDADYTKWLAVGWALLFVGAVFSSPPKLTFVSAAANLNTVADCVGGDGCRAN